MHLIIKCKSDSNFFFWPGNKNMKLIIKCKSNILFLGNIFWAKCVSCKKKKLHWPGNKNMHLIIKGKSKSNIYNFFFLPGNDPDQKLRFRYRRISPFSAIAKEILVFLFFCFWGKIAPCNKQKHPKSKNFGKLKFLVLFFVAFHWTFLALPSSHHSHDERAPPHHTSHLQRSSSPDSLHMWWDDNVYTITQVVWSVVSAAFWRTL